MEDDDVELLEAWRSGDQRAGQALFERYFGPVARFFKVRVTGDIDDLVQQTFEACVGGRDRLRDAGSFRAYVFGVAYNVLRAHFRARRRARTLAGEHDTLPDDQPGPSTWLRAREDEELLQAGLRQLPRPLRSVLELHYFEGLAAPDIARVLVMPEGTVRSRLRRGRRLLRIALWGLGAVGATQELREAPGTTTADS
jgi:RNA polymerase sigma-70 factor (ECF subfamily)